MYDAVCSGCGCETQVPFQPKGNKGVLCRECYRNEKAQEAGRKAAEDAAQPRLFNDQGHAQASTPTQARPATRPQANPPDVQTTSLAVRSVGKAEVLALAPNKAAEITWMEVQVEPAMTYKVGRIKTADGRWVDQLGVLSNFWDFLGQLRGISFLTPKVLENSDDRSVVEVTARYLNQQGHEIEDTEIYEIDCARMLKLTRLKWTPREGSRVEVEEQPVYDQAGNLVDFRRKLPPHVEKEMWDNFLTLKRNKLAKAITCAHRRLIQRALGTKTLTAGALALQFPVIRERFTDAQVHEAVASIYGDEDKDLLGQVSETVEAEIVEEPPAEHPPAPAPETVQQDPDPSPADDEKDLRKDLYSAVFGLARKCGDKGESAVRDRLAEWGCCAVGDDGRPSLRASTIDQIRDAIAWYEALLQEQELAEQTPF